MPGIFFNHETLVLASPLLAMCSTYAFFKFIPLKIGLPFIAIVSVLFRVRAKMIASRSTDEHIDKTIVNDLVSDENAVLAKQEAKIDKKNRIAEQKLRERLKAERKKAEGRGSKMDKDPADDDDEGEMITQFAKGSRKNR